MLYTNNHHLCHNDRHNGQNNLKSVWNGTGRTLEYRKGAFTEEAIKSNVGEKARFPVPLQRGCGSNKCDDRDRAGVSRLLHVIGIVLRVFPPSMSIHVITEQGIIIQKGYTGSKLNAIRPLALHIGKYEPYGVGNKPVLSDIFCRLKMEVMGIKCITDQWMQKQKKVSFTALHKKNYAMPQQVKKQ